MGSDDLSLLTKGVPAVQLFTGAHADYHRPSDTPDKINFDGYQRVRADMGDDGVVGLCMNLPTLLTYSRQPTEGAYYDYFDHHGLLAEYVRLWEDYLAKIASAGFVEVTSTAVEYPGGKGIASANVVAVKPSA
jgi:hypothetical protein